MVDLWYILKNEALIIDYRFLLRNYLHCSVISLSCTEVYSYKNREFSNKYILYHIKSHDIDVIDLVSISNSNRAAVAHMRYLNGRRVSDSKSSRTHSRWYSGCSISQRGWMSKMSIGSDSRISYTDIGFARARERCVDGFRLRGHLRQITMAT